MRNMNKAIAILPLIAISILQISFLTQAGRLVDIAPKELISLA